MLGALRRSRARMARVLLCLALLIVVGFSTFAAQLAYSGWALFLYITASLAVFPFVGILFYLLILQTQMFIAARRLQRGEANAVSMARGTAWAVRTGWTMGIGMFLLLLLAGGVWLPSE